MAERGRVRLAGVPGASGCVLIALWIAQIVAAAAGSWVIVNGTATSSDTALASDWLQGVACAGSSDCWAVGYDPYHPSGNLRTYAAVVAHSVNGVWTQAGSPDLNTASALFAVACAGPADCWAVGGYSYAAGQIPTLPPDGHTLIEHGSDAGWTVVASPGVGRLAAVTCPQANNCWAVGSGSAGPLIEHYDGQTWSVVHSPSPGTLGDLRGVACSRAADCWAVGTYSAGTLIEHYTGASWTVVNSPDEANSNLDRLNAVACPSSDSCWAVGDAAGPDRAIDGEHAVIQHYANGTWQFVDVNNITTAIKEANAFAAVACSSNSDCWAVGSLGGHPLIDGNESGTWDAAVNPNGPQPGYRSTHGQLSAVACGGAGLCWAVGLGDAGGLVASNSGPQTATPTGGGSGMTAVTPSVIFASAAGAVVVGLAVWVWFIRPRAGAKRSA